MMNSILIIAGEKSGENYGAGLVRQFKKLQPPFSFFGIGGKTMEAAGIEILFPIEDLAVVGIFEILSQLPRIRQIFRRILDEVKARKPVAAVLIDSPDFNLRLAKRLKRLSIPILYYISPTVWAWRRQRLNVIKKCVDRMLLIFPFEEKIYKEKEIPARYIGHPLLERIKISSGKQEFFQKYSLDPQKKLVILLPGSRKSEIRYHMPVLMQAMEKLKQAWPVQFILVLAESLQRPFLEKFLPRHRPDMKILTENYYEAIASSDLVLSACGTATLEAALLETPLIAFYRLSPLTYFAGIKLIKIKDYCIVNILAGRKIVPELIQRGFTSENIFKEAKRILSAERIQSEMRVNFNKIKSLLGEERASENAARELEKLIQNHLSKTQWP